MPGRQEQALGSSSDASTTPRAFCFEHGALEYAIKASEKKGFPIVSQWVSQPPGEPAALPSSASATYRR